MTVNWHGNILNIPKPLKKKIKFVDEALIIEATEAFDCNDEYRSIAIQWKLLSADIIRKIKNTTRSYQF